MIKYSIYFGTMVELIIIVYNLIEQNIIFRFFNTIVCIKPYVPREPRIDTSKRRLIEHEIYIRHCQESNSQPVPSQAGADPPRPQRRICCYIICSYPRILSRVIKWLFDYVSRDLNKYVYINKTIF